MMPSKEMRFVCVVAAVWLVLVMCFQFVWLSSNRVYAHRQTKKIPKVQDDDTEL
jgi:hypothetical protein